MGTDIDIQKIFRAKNQILDKILDNLKLWDGEVATGINLIESNQAFFDEIEALNVKLASENLTSIYDEKYEYKLNLIINGQKKLIETLKDRQEDLKDSMEQLKKKDKVVNSYIKTDKEPIFINKKL
jgi:predicted patatin/cPLA2 family phospholipase